MIRITRVDADLKRMSWALQALKVDRISMNVPIPMLNTVHISSDNLLYCTDGYRLHIIKLIGTYVPGDYCVVKNTATEIVLNFEVGDKYKSILPVAKNWLNPMDSFIDPVKYSIDDRSICANKSTKSSNPYAVIINKIIKELPQMLDPNFLTQVFNVPSEALTMDHAVYSKTFKKCPIYFSSKDNDLRAIIQPIFQR